MDEDVLIAWRVPVLLELRLELYVLRDDFHARVGLAVRVRPAVLLQPPHHTDSPALFQVLPAYLREPRPCGDVEVGDLLLDLVVLFPLAVACNGELAHRRALGRVGELSILHATGSLRGKI